jgi:alpha-ketoglutarate-dependent taurine dioxygenase
MSDTRRIDKLRATYRQRWDSHQLIADHNARLEQVGKQPSNEQLINEQTAAEALALARDELVAAMAQLDSQRRQAIDGLPAAASMSALDGGSGVAH